MKFERVSSTSTFDGSEIPQESLAETNTRSTFSKNSFPEGLSSNHPLVFQIPGE